MAYIYVVYNGDEINLSEGMLEEKITIKKGDICAYQIPEPDFLVEVAVYDEDNKLIEQTKTKIMPLYSMKHHAIVNKTDLTQRSPCKLARHPWYFGNVTKKQIYQIFKNSTPGSFFIREEAKFNEYVIEVKLDFEQITSYRIRKDKNKRYYIFKHLKFSTINMLIEFHSSLSNTPLTGMVHYAERNSVSHNVFKEEFTQNCWILNDERVSIDSKFDQGNFGNIFKGTYNGRLVAIKVLSKEKLDGLDNFLAEIACLTMFSHKNIVVLYGVMFKDNEIYSIMEFCSNGSLEAYLHSQSDILSADKINYIALEIAEALEYVSSLNMIHRDVAARNILLTSTFTTKLCDFGNTVTRHKAQHSNELAIRWTAPEIYMLNCHSEFSDVWSYGVLLWEILSNGRLPYNHWSNDEIINRLWNGERLIIPNVGLPSLKQLIMSCWEIVPNKRPNFFNIVKTLKGFMLLNEEVVIDDTYSCLDNN